MRFRRTLLGVTALALLAATVTTTAAAAVSRGAVPSVRPAAANLTRFYKQKLTWTPCPTSSSAKCTWIKVPLNYSQPAGAVIKLRVAIHPASAKSGRLGDLFTNPGGPGGPGIDVALYATGYLPTAVTSRYNVVGIDPRGVGASNPIHCLTTKQLDNLNGFGSNPVNETPVTPTQIATFDAAAKQFGALCKSKNPTLVGQIGTPNAARDMDVVRVVLGQSKLTYYGWSYGTYLGATYADMFPTHVKRFVLDGALDPSLDNVTLAYGQLQGFETAFTRFLADCHTHSNCPPQLRGTLTQNLAVFQALSAKLAKTPDRNTGTSQPLTQELLLTAVIGSLYSDSWGWSDLRVALSDELTQHFGGSLLALAYDETGKDPATGQYASNLTDAFNAISCSDYKAPPNVADLSNEIANTWTTQFPVFGALFAWAQQFCVYWPVHTTAAPRALHAKGSGPILVVGTKYDPATPYVETVALSKQLQHGRLLTWIGDGHTAYNRGSSCIDSSVSTFLVKGVLPPVGRVCKAVTRP